MCTLHRKETPEKVLTELPQRGGAGSLDSAHSELNRVFVSQLAQVCTKASNH